MRILLLHNRYRQPSGEDVAYNAERALLLKEGHDVIEFVRDNSDAEGMSTLRAALHTVWSRASQDELRQLIQRVRPDVAHFHNTFLLISPSAYYACSESRVPVVQTLHNYRLLCPAATFHRDGRVCEDCVGKVPPWPSVLHRCWHGSRSQTSVVAAMLTLHRWLRTWQRKVGVYITLTEFARQKLIQGGLPAERMVVKPNFPYPDPRPRQRPGNYALFLGRLSAEKGIGVLLDAWQKTGRSHLRIVGDGPLADEVRQFVDRHLPNNAEVPGYRSHEEVLNLIKGALFLVLPSEWYEAFPMTIVEAFACGVPVIASRLGAMAEIIEHGRTGLQFEAGSSEDLASKVDWALTHPEEMEAMGREARREYESKYTADRNYDLLMGIYAQACALAANNEPRLSS